MRVVVPVHALLVASLFAAYGGGKNPSAPPPLPDFSLVVSPASISIAQASLSPPLTVSVIRKNGFSGLVDITMTSVPAGVTTLPALPISVLTGASRQVSFSADGVAAVGSFAVIVNGASRTLSHNASLALTVSATPAAIRTYQQGSVLYLESVVGTETSRIGLATQWGGTVVEASFNGTNFVNAHDTGREVQAAQYDACAGCTGMLGWNPTQGGDKYNHGSPLLSQAMSADSIYIKTRPYQWNPDENGGGPTQPVLGDVYVEQWLSSVPNHSRAFNLHCKITHFGLDRHANSTQEFPAVYVSLGFDRYVYYGGTNPWTNGPVTFPPVSSGGAGTSQLFYTPERWAAFVNSQDVGLTVFVPEQYLYTSALTFSGAPGATGNGTNYFAPLTAFTFGPSSTLEGDIYLIAGDYKEARQAIYNFRNSTPSRDIFTPIGKTDLPTPNSRVSGTSNVTGWSFDDVSVSKVEIAVDNVLAGIANYGLARPDVAKVYYNAPLNVGFQFQLDTKKYPNGTHTLTVMVTDTSGNVAAFPDVPINILN
jgi:hypothetical protein